MGAYSREGLLTIYDSREGAFSRGGGCWQFEDLYKKCNCARNRAVS